MFGHIGQFGSYNTLIYFSFFSAVSITRSRTFDGSVLHCSTHIVHVPAPFIFLLLLPFGIYLLYIFVWHFTSWFWTLKRSRQSYNFYKWKIHFPSPKMKKQGFHIVPYKLSWRRVSLSRQLFEGWIPLLKPLNDEPCVRTLASTPKISLSNLYPHILL